MICNKNKNMQSEYLEKTLSNRQFIVMKNIMMEALLEANKIFIMNDAYSEHQRSKQFSYDFHKVLTKKLDEDHIASHIDLKTRVENQSGMFNVLYIENDDIIITVCSAEKDRLPSGADYKRKWATKNRDIDGQVSLFEVDMIGEGLSGRNYAILTYELRHEKGNTKYEYLDLIVPNRDFNSIIDWVDLYNLKFEVFKSDNKRRSLVSHRRDLIEIKESEDNE